MSTPDLPQNRHTGDAMRLSFEEWVAEGERRFGPDREMWAFVCPLCSHEATVAEWTAVGARASAGFACIGRWRDNARDAFAKGPGPCNYSGGGLFKLNPVAVTAPDGQETSMFEFAPARAAKGAR